MGSGGNRSHRVSVMGSEGYQRRQHPLNPELPSSAGEIAIHLFSAFPNLESTLQWEEGRASRARPDQKQQAAATWGRPSQKAQE